MKFKKTRQMAIPNSLRRNKQVKICLRDTYVNKNKIKAILKKRIKHTNKTQHLNSFTSCKSKLKT